MFTTASSSLGLVGRKGGWKLPFSPSFIINIALSTKQTILMNPSLVPSSLLIWTKAQWEGGLMTAD